jgi:hypothetical protein
MRGNAMEWEALPHAVPCNAMQFQAPRLRRVRAVLCRVMPSHGVPSRSTPFHDVPRGGVPLQEDIRRPTPSPCSFAQFHAVRCRSAPSHVVRCRPIPPHAVPCSSMLSNAPRAIHSCPFPHPIFCAARRRSLPFPLPFPTLRLSLIQEWPDPSEIARTPSHSEFQPIFLGENCESVREKLSHRLYSECVPSPIQPFVAGV